MDFWTIAICAFLCAWSYHQGKQSDIARLKKRNQSLENALRDAERNYDLLLAATSRRRAHPAEKSWKEVFGYQKWNNITREDIRNTYRRLAETRHPDRGGSVAAMQELNVARDQAMKEILT